MLGEETPIVNAIQSKLPRCCWFTPIVASCGRIVDLLSKLTSPQRLGRACDGSSSALYWWSVCYAGETESRTILLLKSITPQGDTGVPDGVNIRHDTKTNALFLEPGQMGIDVC
jgi:hypothetical protein